MSEEQQLNIEEVDDQQQEEEKVQAPPVIEYKLNERTEIPNSNETMFKTVLKEGTGKSYPKPGDTVVCHYTGTKKKDGSQFDSSRDRGQPFEFVIAQGSVIQLWDRGMLTLKKGERAILEGDGSVCYGPDTGAESGRPMGTLCFDVEMISFGKPMEDVSENKDHSVMRQIIDEGKDQAKPAYESSVTCEVAVFKGTDENIIENVSDAVAIAGGLSFVFGDLDAPQQFYDCVRCMLKSETSRFVVSGFENCGEVYAQILNIVSSSGKESASASTSKLDADDIAAGQNGFTIKISMHQFDAVQAHGYKNQEKIDEAKKRKEQGTVYFKAQKWFKAKAKYERGAEFVNNDFGLDTEELKAAAREIRYACQGNASQCAMQLGDFMTAIHLCDKILDENLQHTKSLFRKAKSLNALNEYEAAEPLLQYLLELEPSNAAASQEMASVLGKKKAHHDKEKALFGNMFSRVDLSSAEEREREAQLAAEREHMAAAAAAQAEQQEQQQQEQATTTASAAPVHHDPVSPDTEN